MFRIILNYVYCFKYGILYLEYQYQILYICSLNLRLKIKQNKYMDAIKKKLSFKDYYDSLTPEDKLTLRHGMVPVYMQYSTFYYKVDKNKFTDLELEKLELLTGENFTR